MPRCVVATLLLAFLATGYSPATPQEPAQADTSTSEGILPVTDVQLLGNTEFGLQSGERMVGWTSTRGELIEVLPNDGPNRSPVVKMLAPPSDTWNTLLQRLEHRQLAGGRVKLRAYTKSDEPRTLLLALRYRIKGAQEDEILYNVHPGTGKWRWITVETELPSDIVSNSVTVRIVLRPSATKPAFVDSAYALFTGKAPSYALDVSDGDFETHPTSSAATWTSEQVGPTRWSVTPVSTRPRGVRALSVLGADLDTPRYVHTHSPSYPVQTGDFVTCRFWARTNGDSRYGLKTFIEGKSGEVWDSLQEPVISMGENREWEEIRSSVVVPHGVTDIRFVAAIAGAERRSVEWAIDDVEIAVTSFNQYVQSHRQRERLEDTVLIGIDTLRQDSLGSYGAVNAYTPNLDMLAAEGVKYSNVTAASSWTKPSFGSIITSLYPIQHRATHVDRPLRADAVTLAEALRERGFFTAGFVCSAPDGFLGSKMNFDQGFDLYIEEPDRDEVHAKMMQFLKFNGEALKSMKGGGIFLFYHSYDPHTPFRNRDPELLQNRGLLGTISINHPTHLRAIGLGTLEINDEDIKYIRDLYQSGVSLADDRVGQMIRALKWTGLFEDMHVVLCADHGESLGERSTWGHGMGYEEIVRTPLIIRSPKRFPAGTVDSKTLVSNLDIMPTILELTGTDIPPHCEGRSLISPSPESYTARLGVSEDALHGWFTLRDDRYRFVMRRYSKPEQKDGSTPGGMDTQLFLYDLENDPQALHDLSEEFPRRLAKMHALLDEHLARVRKTVSLNVDVESVSPETLEQLEALGYLP